MNKLNVCKIGMHFLMGLEMNFQNTPDESCITDDFISKYFFLVNENKIIKKNNEFNLSTQHTD